MTLQGKFNELDSEFDGASIFYHNAEECEKIAEDFAVKFAEWLRKECYDTGSHWLYQEDDEIYNSVEILEVFKRLPQAE